MGFSWIVHSGLFSAEWWLPKLETLSKMMLISNAHSGFCEELLKASEHDLMAVLAILENQVEFTQDEYGKNYNMDKDVTPVILAKAEHFGDVDVLKRATTLMDRLGDRGMIDLREQVNAYKERLVEESVQISTGMTQG
jgi:hypothetical protein